MSVDVIVTNSGAHHSEAKRWCHDNVGYDWWSEDERGDWSYVTIDTVDYPDGRQEYKVCYMFNSERDAVEFALRWV